MPRMQIGDSRFHDRRRIFPGMFPSRLTAPRTPATLTYSLFRIHRKNVDSNIQTRGPEVWCPHAEHANPATCFLGENRYGQVHRSVRSSVGRSKRTWKMFFFQKEMQRPLRGMDQPEWPKGRRAQSSLDLIQQKAGPAPIVVGRASSCLYNTDPLKSYSADCSRRFPLPLFRPAKLLPSAKHFAGCKQKNPVPGRFSAVRLLFLFAVECP